MSHFGPEGLRRSPSHSIIHSLGSVASSFSSKLAAAQVTIAERASERGRESERAADSVVGTAPAAAAAVVVAATPPLPRPGGRDNRGGCPSRVFVCVQATTTTTRLPSFRPLLRKTSHAPASEEGREFRAAATDHCRHCHLILPSEPAAMAEKAAATAAVQTVDCGGGAFKKERFFSGCSKRGRESNRSKGLSLSLSALIQTDENRAREAPRKGRSTNAAAAAPISYLSVE